MQLPVENRKGLYVPPFKVLIEGSQISITNLDFDNSRFGRKWMECIDNEWLKELEQKEKEVGNLQPALNPYNINLNSTPALHSF